MKSIVLSVVVISALMVAGIGGTLADFSDYEVSEGNYFQTGSLDLAVSDFAGNHYNGEAMPAIYEQEDAWPCCDKSRYFDLENFGQGAQYEPNVYIHFKNMDCYWVQPKDGSVVWVDENCNVVDAPANAPGPGEPQGDLPDFPKPLTEPEYVAECGGIAGEDRDGDPVTVPGLGLCYGEDCQLPEHIGVKLWITDPYPEELKPARADLVPDDDFHKVDLSAYDTNGDGVIKLNELECVQFKLAKLPCNTGMWVHIALHLQDIDEDDLIADGVLDDPGTGYGWFDDTNAIEKKFDHWPTNAIQKDGVKFDMAFELLQVGP